ncbi:MAG: restriction endonuclease subunit S, partial [Oscillospiraceae bacterium]|nr:restriction endonuclease subunit S [Oscillospiraceae bacterium]
TVYDVSGVNRDKEFFEPSKQVGEDTSKYKIVPPNYFACNLMHVGRDVLLPIALNHSGNNKYVSPAYTVFRVKEDAPVLKEYFFMMLKSDERDRYFWFHTDASVRDGMSWDDFCDLEVRLPSISVQQKYVDIYNAMLANQRSYECGLTDLKLAIDAGLEQYKHTAKRIPLKELLSEVDVRNTGTGLTSVYGITMSKEFIPSVANLDGVDLTRYKLVSPGQMACNFMHVGRDESLPIAINNTGKALVVSPAYFVFDAKSHICLPEFVVMWLSREESGRFCWYISDTSVRGSFSLDCFYEIEIPVPNIAEQQYITNIFIAYQLRKEINDQLKTQIKDLCPILIKGSIEEASA